MGPDMGGVDLDGLAVLLLGASIVAAAGAAQAQLVEGLTAARRLRLLARKGCGPGEEEGGAGADGRGPAMSRHLLSGARRVDNWAEAETGSPRGPGYPPQCSSSPSAPWAAAASTRCSA